MKKKILYLTIGVLLGLLARQALLAPKNETKKTDEISAAIVEAPIIPTTQEIKTKEPTNQKTSSGTNYPVVKVIDGDTIAINMNGKTETLRLIGINTPETVDPRKAVECFGKEASTKAKELLTEKNVRVEMDPTQGERDKYGRLLTYIRREDGLFFNKYMIEEGYAYEYTYNTPYKYQVEFKTAQREAQENKKGLWKEGACETKTTTTTLKNPPAPAAPLPQQGDYSCASNLYNCTDFKTQKQAQSVFETCGGGANDIHKLDSDKDGVVCESLP